MSSLQRYSEEAYALLRIVAGFLFAFHGAQKLFGVFSDHPQPEFLSQIWLGGIIELVGGVAIMLGAYTQVAAFVCSGMMAVAYFQFHWKFEGGAKMFPAVNQGELAVVYCFVFLMFACRGGGKWSMDSGSDAPLLDDDI
jgi:putative oxidoreductase